MAKLNNDTAFELDLEGIYEGVAFTFLLEKYQDDAATIPQDWADAPFTISFSDTPGGAVKQLTLTSAAGITRSGNLLTISATDAQNVLEGGKAYFYDLVSTTDGKSIVEGRGKAKIKYCVSK